MTFLEKVAEAPNQRDAMLLIAGALDEIYGAIVDRNVDDRKRDDSNNDWTDEWVHRNINAPLVVIDADEFREAQRDPRLKQLVDEADAYLDAYLDARMHKEGTDYVIPKPSPALELERARFSENFLTDPVMAGTYVKGGPEWLTAYDTEFVMTLPGEARQLMALDYEKRGLTQEAREFAVAFLKGDASNMATAAPLADTFK